MSKQVKINEQNALNDIKKEDFILVQSDKILYDESIKTKPIGYYKDAMLRFRKNKASVAAAVILMFLILMAIIGPWIFKYDLPYDDRGGNAKWSTRLAELPPKISALSGWEFFAGTKEIDGFPLYFEELEAINPDIVLEILTEPNEVGQVTARVDFYELLSYRYSINQFTNITPTEYAAVVAHDEAILADDNPDNDDEIILLQDAPLINGFHKVKVDFYAFLKEVYNVEKVEFWFGTDSMGRDLFTLLWKGARLSLMIAAGVSLINIIIGLIIGSISGYYGGIVDLTIQRLSEIIGGLPFIAILTLLMLRYGSEIWVVILAFTLTGWLGISGLTRTQFYRYKYREYVLAARTLGAKDRRIMSRHIFPNAVGTLITSLVLYIPGVIFTESVFSFLGIINYQENTSIGRLLSNGQAEIKDSFYMVVFPAIFISLLMLSFNLFGNGLRDAFNPSLRGVEE